jgi:lysophospholipase L1-like esterase
MGQFERQAPFLIAIVLVFLAGTLVGLRAPLVLRQSHEWMVRHFVPYDFSRNPAYLARSRLYADEDSKFVTMLGDSLTEYADWQALLNRPDIANQGIAGDVTAGILARLHVSVRMSKIVFLNVGINDARHFIAISESQENIRRIISVLSQSSKVYLQSIVFTQNDDLNLYVRQMNDFAMSYCDTKICTYVDLNSRLAENGKLKSSFALDDIHINSAGYAEWAALLRPLIP